jgi:hypothetical protein
VSPVELTDGREGIGLGEEPIRTKARKPSPQYSLDSLLFMAGSFYTFEPRYVLSSFINGVLHFYLHII